MNEYTEQSLFRSVLAGSTAVVVIVAELGVPWWVVAGLITAGFVMGAMTGAWWNE